MTVRRNMVRSGAGAALALLMLGVSRVDGADVTVRKTAREENPSLALVSFAGPAELRQRLDQTLRRCGWFAVTADAQSAQYRLAVAYHDRGAPSLRMQVTSGNREVADFQEHMAAGGDMTRLIFRSVDRLIHDLFDNPGLCTSKLAFVVGNGGTKEIFISNFDGTDPERLTHNRSISTEPAWARDANRLAYTLYQRHRMQVVVADLRQRTQQRLTSFPGLNSGAAISPDGRTVAVSLSRDHTVDLYVVQVEDRRLRRLTDGSAVDSSPTWSPDGRRICFVSDRAGRPRLYVVPATGGDSRRLFNDPDEAVSPDWSPVSNQIVFSTRQPGGNYQIAVLDMNRTPLEKRVVTAAAGDWESPSWGPDGRHVVCSRRVGNQQQLYMVDTRTGRTIPITKPGNVSLPAWSGLLTR